MCINVYMFSTYIYTYNPQVTHIFFFFLLRALRGALYLYVCVCVCIFILCICGLVSSGAGPVDPMCDIARVIYIYIYISYMHARIYIHTRINTSIYIHICTCSICNCFPILVVFVLRALLCSLISIIRRSGYRSTTKDMPRQVARVMEI